MIDKNDWRLMRQEEYLKGVPLIRVNPADYALTLQNKQWHEHCEFCMKTIYDSSAECYATTDYYRWICDECFNDFKEIFAWQVKYLI